MDSQLNFHHLRLFRAVARTGSVTAAARALHLTPQTVSKQVQDLERALDAQLLERSGRTVRVTRLGQFVARSADEIFERGRELVEAVHLRRDAIPTRLVVGVADVMPKLIVRHLIEPLFAQELPVVVECREGSPERLLASLAVHELDVVLSDAPAPAHLGVQTFDHVLGTCDVVLVAVPEMADALRTGFPGSLEGAPLLAPGRGSVLRGMLDRWLERRGLHPTVVGEFDDSALAKEFAAVGHGAIVVPSVIGPDVGQRHGLAIVGTLEGVRERFFAISTERRLRHPAVASLARAARSQLFGRGDEPGVEARPGT